MPVRCKIPANGEKLQANQPFLTKRQNPGNEKTKNQPKPVSVFKLNRRDFRSHLRLTLISVTFLGVVPCRKIQGNGSGAEIKAHL
jgi:hypothetical protein